MSLDRSRQQIGRTLEVLVEGVDKKGLGTQARTRTNRIVHLHEPLAPGTFAHARIGAAAAHHLTGEIVPTPDARPRLKAETPPNAQARAGARRAHRLR